MTTTEVYQVSGMTCGHCVRAVTDEISSLAGVSEVAVDLVPKGVSTVTVTSDQPLDPKQIAEAVDEAGYEFVPVAKGESESPAAG